MKQRVLGICTVILFVAGLAWSIRQQLLWAQTLDENNPDHVALVEGLYRITHTMP